MIYDSQIYTRSDKCNLFICYLNLTYEIYEITKELIFDLPSWLVELAKHAWTKQRKQSGRQKVEKR